MKILVLYQDWNDMFGKRYGFFEHWFKEKDGAYGKEHDYHIIALSTKEGQVRTERNILVTRIRTTPATQFLAFPRMKSIIRKELEEWKPDVIYSPYVYLLSLVPKGQRELKVVGFLRERTSEMVRAKGGLRRLVAPMFTVLDRRAMRRIDMLFYNGASMERYARDLGYTGETVFAPRQLTDVECYPTADSETVIKKHHLQGKKVILMVCRLTPEKNPAMGIKAMKSLPPGYRLVIVGEGEQQQYLERLAKREGVTGKVVFAGFVPHPELWQYYKAADVLWLLSRTDFEGMPNVVLEAMHAEVPCIVTDVLSMHNIVEDGKNGIILQTFRPEELAQRTEEIIKRRASRSMIVREGARTVKSIQEQRVKVIDALAQATAGRRKKEGKTKRKG